MRGIIWFRRDLRLADQAALSEACKDCREVIPLFISDEPLLRSRQFGSACVNFMLGCLRELASSLAASGLALQWRRGEPVEEVVRAAREWNADVVYWNLDYEPDAIAGDRKIVQRLGQAGIAVRTFKDHVVFETEEVRGATGEALQRVQCLPGPLVDQVACHQTGFTGSPSRPVTKIRRTGSRGQSDSRRGRTGL
jgi:deoxyribodipyrimidine photo-lyase